MLRITVTILAAFITTAASATNTGRDASSNDSVIEKGRYLFQAADCYACHTDIDNDGAPLAGGRALETGFGTFYTPNITPDKSTGIGNWTDEDFVRALTDGISPSGQNFFPAFPYLSYKNMNREDMLAIKAYIFSQLPVHRPNKPHQLKWYVSRAGLPVWKYLNNYFGTPVSYNQTRGSYMVDVLGHCNECHTPRNVLGMLQMQNRLHGNKEMDVPDISATKHGIGDWSRDELTDLLKYGEMPDGDYVADEMGEVVDYSTSKWTDDDINAAIDYLLRK